MEASIYKLHVIQQVYITHVNDNQVCVLSLFDLLCHKLTFQKKKKKIIGYFSNIILYINLPMEMKYKFAIQHCDAML